MMSEKPRAGEEGVEFNRRGLRSAAEAITKFSMPWSTLVAKRA
jgi:hypothetical protein